MPHFRAASYWCPVAGEVQAGGVLRAGGTLLSSILSPAGLGAPGYGSCCDRMGFVSPLCVLKCPSPGLLYLSFLPFLGHLPPAAR